MVIMFRKPLFRNPAAPSSVLPEFRLVIWYYGRTLVIAGKLGLLGQCSD